MVALEEGLGRLTDCQSYRPGQADGRKRLAKARLGLADALRTAGKCQASGHEVERVAAMVRRVLSGDSSYQAAQRDSGPILFWSW